MKLYFITDFSFEWEPSELPSAIQVDDEFQLKIFSCVTSESFSKWEHMGLNEHLQASTVAGLIETYKGASLYLSDRASPAEATRTLVCRTISKTERLDLPTLLNHNVTPVDDGLPAATHVVVGVLYGAEIYCVLVQNIQDEDSRQKNEDKLSEISNKMGTALENNQDLAEFKELFDKEEKLLIGRLKCRLYADLQTQPVRECSIFEAYKYCLKLIEKIKIANIAVPINIILCSLESILGPTGALGNAIEYRDVDGDLASRLCHIWNDLEKVRGKADAIRAASKKSHRISLRQFGEVVVEFQEMLKDRWKRSIVKARQSEDGDDDVEKDVQFAESHPLLKASSLERWLSYKKAELEMAGKMGSIDGVTLLASKMELEKELGESLDKKFSLLLTVPPLDERTNEKLQVMKSYVNHLTLPIREDEDTDEEEDDLPWYLIERKRKQVLDKMREFADHVEKNKHLENRVQFFITFGEIGERFGCKYSVFQSGNLLLDNRRGLPDPPSGLRIRFASSGNQSAIRLMWDHEDCGWPCHFVVQYRVTNHLNWKQQKTSKTGETETILYLENGSVLEMRVAAETCVGLGDFSDIADSTSTVVGFEEAKLQPPTGVKLKFATQNTAELGWSSSPGVASYRIHYWKNGQISSVRQIDSKETNCRLNELLPGTTYLVNIFSISNDGLEMSGPSETAELTTLIVQTDSSTGLQQDGSSGYEYYSITSTLINAVVTEVNECADKVNTKNNSSISHYTSIIVLFFIFLIFL